MSGLAWRNNIAYFRGTHWITWEEIYGDFWIDIGL